MNSNPLFGNSLKDKVSYAMLGKTITAIMSYQQCSAIGIDTYGCLAISDLFYSLSRDVITRNPSAWYTNNKISLAEIYSEPDEQAIINIAEHTQLLFVVADLAQAYPFGSLLTLFDILTKVGGLTVALVTSTNLFRDNLESYGVAGYENNYGVITSIISGTTSSVQAKLLPPKHPERYGASRSLLGECVQAIFEIIDDSGAINLDIGDLKGVMSLEGQKWLSIGYGHGIDALSKAVKYASSNPFLDSSLKKTKKAVVEIVGGSGLTLYEVNEALQTVRIRMDQGEEMRFGVALRDNMRQRAKFIICAGDLN